MTSNAFLELYFSKYSNYELEETKFFLPTLAVPIEAYRYAGQFQSTKTPLFRHTSGMVALAQTFVKIARDPSANFTHTPIQFGSRGSVAHAVNRCLVQPNRYLFDCFGYTREGNPTLRKLLAICNSNLKIPSKPIRIFFRPNFLAPDSVRIFLNGARVTQKGVLLEMEQDLESQFYQKSKSPILHTEKLSLVA